MTYEEFLVALTDTTPKQAFYILRDNPDQEHKKGYELVISKDAEYSYWYALFVIQGRFESGENAISKDARFSFNYARNVMKSRWLEVEELIRNSDYKYDYSTYVVEIFGPKNPNFWKNQ